MALNTAPRRGGIALAVAAVTALGLSACSGSGGSVDEEGGDADTSKVVIALEADMAPNGYDPLRYSTGQRFFFEGMYDSLFTLDEEGLPTPGAATSFEFNEDFTEMTMDLDTSIVFDDGTALSADLVKQNLDQRDNPELGAYRELVIGGEAEISEVVVVDDDTVTLVFGAPQPGFQGNLTFPGGALIGPAGLADRASLDTTPDGSGPLTIDEGATVKGNTYLQVKKEGTDRGDEYPFDAYEFRPILDPQARTNAAISGEVDLAIVGADTTEQIEGSGTGLVENGGNIYNLIRFDKTGAVNPAFADPRVFKALSIAIDREAYVNAVHPGQEPTANVMPKDSPGYLPELEEEYAYDPEGAMELLAEAGYPDGFEFEFIISPRSQRDLEALQPYWAAIGVDVVLTTAASDEQRFAATRTNYMGGPFQANWSNPLGVVNGVLFGFANQHGGEAPEIQAAATEYGAAQTDEERAEALQNLNRAIVEAGWLGPLYEEFVPWAFAQEKIAEPTFPGAEPYPILGDVQPAS
ncbi:ABC transporter substrate-binding protein [Microbacterium sp. NPDC077184]|uniref:ABC transporter substrate-binding protein n=1 Tax=Microbacterium sp. NPDC077184 TaxID=3154764 RepID=UPI0034343455